jgi:hypothetical protein
MYTLWGTLGLQKTRLCALDIVELDWTASLRHCRILKNLYSAQKFMNIDYLPGGCGADRSAAPSQANMRIPTVVRCLRCDMADIEDFPIIDGLGCLS